MRRLQYTGEEGRTVGVAPMEIVDKHDQGLVLRETGQKLAQSGKGAPAEFLDVRDLRRLAAPDEIHFAKDWKEPNQRGKIPRQDLFQQGRGQVFEIPHQLVDDTVERLVGYRLTLETPAHENQDV